MSARLSALDFITACLRIHPDIESDKALRSVIASERIDWYAVIAIANTQFVAPLLWVALTKRGLSDELPPDVSDYLCEIHRLNTIRNSKLRAQTIEAARQFNSIGIEPMLLKGSAILFDNLLDDIGWRVMVDIDIMVPPKAAQECWDALLNLGYRPIDKDFDYALHHHLKPLHRQGDYATIEIHRAMLSTRAVDPCATGLAWQHSEKIAVSGVAMSIPAPTFRILHNILHSGFENRAYVKGAIPLQSLYELALIKEQNKECIDWPMIRKLMDKSNSAKILQAFVYLSHRFFGSSLSLQAQPVFSTRFHYARCRQQFRWRWIQEFINRAYWFSTSEICRLYACDSDFISVNKGRLRLALDISWRKSYRAVRWFRHRLRDGQA